MKAFSKTVLLSSVLLGAQIAAVPAMAQKTEPSGTYSGLVDVEKGIQLVCTLTLEVDDVNNTAEVTYFGPPVNNPECSSITFLDQPYDYTFNPATGDITLTGVQVDTITAGDCAGSITANWTDDEIFIDTFLPADTGGPDCTILGILD